MMKNSAMHVPLERLPARADLVDRVYHALLDAVSTGALTPQTRITQEEIAERLGVSRSPVLQALRQLKRDGFILDAPNRGVRAAPLEVPKVLALYEVRGALDSLAARKAAARKAQLDPELIDAGRRASQARDVAALIEADLAFHGAIYQASGNDLIAETASLHWAHLRRVMGAVLQSSGQREAIWDEHQAIAEAIAAGDVAKAGELTDLHTTRASRNLAARLEELLKQQPG